METKIENKEISTSFYSVSERNLEKGIESSNFVFRGRKKRNTNLEVEFQFPFSCVVGKWFAIKYAHSAPFVNTKKISTVDYQETIEMFAIRFLIVYFWNETAESMWNRWGNTKREKILLIAIIFAQILKTPSPLSVSNSRNRLLTFYNNRQTNRIS